MNSIEDRLKAATQAAAATVADFSAPPLRLPERNPRMLAPRRRVSAKRLLAPVAAAATVAAVAGAVVAVRGGLTAGGTSGSPAAAALRAVPPYFVALAHPGPLSARQPRTAVAVVGTTTTGAIIARVNVPAPYNSFVSVSAAADDRTFVLAAQKLPAPPKPGYLTIISPRTRFYLLRIDPGGQQPAVLTPLPLQVLPAGYFGLGGSIALSPDGSQLAVPLDRESRHPLYGVRVYELSDGTYRTWLLPSRLASFSPGVGSPSWAPDSKHLALLVSSTKPRACVRGCVELLDTTTPGGSVLPDSVAIFQTSAIRRLIGWNTSLLSTDGSRVLLAGMVGRKLRDGVTEYNLPVVYGISVTSGQVLSLRAAPSDEELFPLWASPAARFFAVARPIGDFTISVAIYGPRGAPVEVRLPARTLGAAW